MDLENQKRVKEFAEEYGTHPSPKKSTNTYPSAFNTSSSNVFLSTSNIAYLSLLNTKFDELKSF